MATKKNTRNFFIKQVYATSVSFDIQKPASAISEKWEPTADFSMQVTDSKQKEDYVVGLIVEAKVKIKDTEVFNIKVHQAGEFAISGYDNAQLDRLLKSFCPNILFPYLRQLVTQMTTQAGFPPLNLSPVDFESRYQEMLEAQKEKAK